MSNRHALHQAKRRDRLRNAKRHDISRNARRHRSITRAPTQSGSQRKAGPAAQTELRDRLLYRAVIIAKPLARIAFGMQLTANGSQHHFARGQTLRRTIRSEENALYISPRRRFVCGQNRSSCPPGQNERFLPAYTATWWTFSTIFCSWRAISKKPHFMGYIPQKNRSSCPEATKMNDSSQFTKENARFSRDRLKQASFAGHVLLRILVATAAPTLMAQRKHGAMEARWSLWPPPAIIFTACGRAATMPS